MIPLFQRLSLFASRVNLVVKNVVQQLAMLYSPVATDSVIEVKEVHMPVSEGGVLKLTHTDTDTHTHTHTHTLSLSIYLSISLSLSLSLSLSPLFFYFILFLLHRSPQTVFRSLGDIFGVLITLDEIVRSNSTLQQHWTLYKR